MYGLLRVGLLVNLLTIGMCFAWFRLLFALWWVVFASWATCCTTPFMQGLAFASVGCLLDVCGFGLVFVDLIQTL